MTSEQSKEWYAIAAEVERISKIAPLSVPGLVARITDYIQALLVEKQAHPSGTCSDCGEPDDCPIWLIANKRGREGDAFTCGFWKPDKRSNKATGQEVRP